MNAYRSLLKCFIGVFLVIFTAPIVTMAVDFVPLETFDSWPPTDWTIVDGGSTPDTWMQDPGSRTSWGSEPVALADSDAAGSGTTMDEQLITPLLDCSSASTVIIEFDQYFRYYSSGGNEHTDVDVSTDGGSSWTTVFTQSGASVGSEAEPDHQMIDISSYAAGHSNVQVRFHYADAAYDYFWALDNIWIYEPDANCVQLSPSISSGHGMNGMVVDHLITIYNCGSSANVFDLSISDNNWSTEITDLDHNPISSIDVNAQESAQFLVRVTVPSATGQDVASLTATVGSPPVNDPTSTITIITDAVVYLEDFSEDPTGEWLGFEADHWEWGSATASTSCSGPNQDPDFDHSPSSDNNIVGFNIGGCYQNNLSVEYLTSPEIDLTGYEFATFGFARWLGVESSSYDHASVEISNDGSTWNTLWEHDGSSFADAGWIDVSFDISSYLTTDQTIYIRFGMGPTDSSVAYCGWNIDDIYIQAFETGTVTGTVTDDQGPIQNATITAVETGTTATSGPDGTYSMNLPEGTYTLTCEAIGYNPVTVNNVDIPPSGTVTVDFYMTYPEIDVSPTSFEETLNINTSLNRTLTVSNSGTGDLNYSASIQYITDKDMWDLIYDMNIHALTNDQSMLGAEFAFGHIWVTGAASDPSNPPNYLYEISADGTTILNQYEQASSAASDWGYRDLASDGTYLYAGCGSRFYQINPADGSVVHEVTHSLGIVIRALAYIPETGTFVTGDFDSNIIEFSFDGSSVTQIRSFDLGLDAKYGMAYDNLSPDGPFLYIFDQSGSPSTTIYQADISTPGAETLTGVSYVLPLLADESDQLAGGLFVTKDWDTSRIILGGLVQGTDGGGNSLDKVFGLELAPAASWLSLDHDSATVPSSTSDDITVTFDANEVDFPGDYQANIIITSNDGDESPLTIPVTMHVQAPYWFRIVPEYQEGSEEASQSIDYTVTIFNIGDLDDTYDLAITSANWTTTLPGGSTVSVPSGGSEFFTVRVEVPTSASIGDTDLATFSVTSQGEPTMTLEGQILTTCSESNGSIGGTVTHDGSVPIEGAVVTIEGTTLSDITLADGTYFIDNVPVGTGYTVHFEATGYNPLDVTNVDVAWHETTTVDADLHYPEIDVTPLNVSYSIAEGATETLTDAVVISNLGNGYLDFTIDIAYPTNSNEKDINILLVDDDGGVGNGGPHSDVESIFETALTNAGYSFDLWTVDFSTPTTSGPTASDMAPYDVVIWFLGETWNYNNDQDTLTPSDEASLATYLDNGGALFLSGQDYLYNIHPTSVSFSPGDFQYDYLGLASVTQDEWSLSNPITETCLGETGSIADGMNFGLNDPYTTAKDGLYPDYFDSLTSDASNLFQIASGGSPEGPCASIVDTGTFKSIFTTCSFAGFVDGSSPSTKAEFIAAAVDYLSGGAGGWLTVTPTSGHLEAGDNQNLDFEFDASNLQTGVYTAQVIISSNDGDEPQVTVNVTLYVGDVPTYTPTPTPTPTSTPTPSEGCSDLDVQPWDIDFNPPMAQPGDQVDVSATIHNIGSVDVHQTVVHFGYEKTPYDPSDDPNIQPIGEAVTLTDIGIGSSKTATTTWDTTGLEPINYIVYVYITDTNPEECEPGTMTQTDYLVPVKLYRFVAIPENGKVKLEWTTETEIDNIGFHVYRNSTYLGDFEKVSNSMIPGAGTSFTLHDYSFIDTNVVNDTPYFYKLASIDSTGDISWSPIVSTVPNASGTKLLVNTGSDRKIYYKDTPLNIFASIQNYSNRPASVHVQILLLIDYVYVGDLFPPFDVTFDPDLDVSFELFHYDWTGVEPASNYLIATLVTDNQSNELVHLDITDFNFLLTE